MKQETDRLISLSCFFKKVKFLILKVIRDIRNLDLASYLVLIRFYDLNKHRRMILDIVFQIRLVEKGLLYFDLHFLHYLVKFMSVFNKHIKFSRSIKKDLMDLSNTYKIKCFSVQYKTIFRD